MSDWGCGVSDPLALDKTVWEFWLRGLSLQESCEHMIRIELPRGDKRDSNDEDDAAEQRLMRCIRSDIADHYMNFTTLSPFLQEPGSACYQVLQLTGEVLGRLVEQFYELDPVLARCVVGKKLSRSSREIEGISQRTNIRFGSCERQVENMVRLYKAVFSDDDEYEQQVQYVGVTTHLVSTFCISSILANQYWRILFLCHHRFETNKKRLQVLTCGDYELFSQVILKHWCINDVLDMIFIDELRSLKTMVLANKVLLDRFKAEIEVELLRCQEFKEHKDSVPKFVARTAGILKHLCAVGYKLIRPKELRDLFVDLCDEVVVSSLIKFSPSSLELSLFFEAMLRVCIRLHDDFPEILILHQYLSATTPICFVMYQRVIASEESRMRWFVNPRVTLSNMSN